MNSPYFSPSSDAVLEGFAISPQQADQWRWQQQCGAAAIAPASLWLRIDAPLDLQRLRASLAQVVARHEILRTSYRQVTGMAEPMQVIAPQAELAWLAPGQDGPGVEVLGDDGTGLRLQLRLAPFQADADSLHQLAHDWLSNYHGNLQGEALQYADYAAWRTELLEGAQAAHPLWEPARRQTPWAQPLPLRPHASGAPAASEHQSAPLSLCPQAQARWQAYARASGRRPELVLLAAWVALCHQHAGAASLCLGIDIGGRGDSTAGAVGLYGQALPLLLSRLDAIDFDTLCQELERQCGLLVECRDSYPPGQYERPFALGFRTVAPPAAALAAAGWHIERVCAPAAPFQILLETGSAGLRWHYNAHVYDHAAVAILGEQLGALLDSACRQPRSLLGQLEACGEREQGLLATELCHSPALTEAQRRRYDAVNRFDSLAACFAGQAAATPDRAAIKSASGALSYRALDQQSDDVARHLLARGLGPEARVVHLLPRELEAVAAMLGIFKAGCCYVPVDPSYPAQRVQFILEDCQAEAIVTHSTLLALLPAHLRERVIMLDTLTQDAAPEVAMPAAAREHCAYLIYTSGSTGQPKGVQITHANALHSLAARAAYYSEPVGVFLLLSSFAFDSSIAGLFWTLAQGGTLIVCSQEQQKDPAQLARIVRRESVTHLLALPSLHALLLEQPGTPPAALSTVIVAGETCSPQLVRDHACHWPGARLYNEYGPTEASVWSSVALCDLSAQGLAPVPIGRAIPFGEVHVLDAAGAPAARGMVGEIHIGGPGLSPGYAGRPDLSAEKFVIAGHPLLAGRRLYRSGDLGYLDQDGVLHFAGRADAQVKLRGYRIELGEIEAALREASGAALAVVLAETSDGGQYLRAFIESPSGADVPALRAALALRLPEYMIPADIQAVASMPRSANGKIDNQALLAMRACHQRPPYAAPSSTAEHRLVTLWQELLGVEAPGTDDDFFALGGHSLLVVRLVHRLQVAGHALQVGSVFRNPTIRMLAAELTQQCARSCLQPMRSGTANGQPVYFLHRPAGDVQHYAALAASLPPAARAYGLVLPPATGPDQASLPDLARRYLADIQAIQPCGPYYLCGWSMGGLLALELASLIEAQGQTVGMLAIIDSSFSAQDEGLARDALLRAVRAELCDDSQRRLDGSAGARQELAALAPEMGRAAQLRHALEQWTGAHAMALRAEPAVVAATLDAMDHARRWVAPYQAPPVAARLHLWWAEDTVATQPALPAQWGRLSAQGACEVLVPGDHDAILEHPIFLASFHTTLARLLATSTDGNPSE